MHSCLEVVHGTTIGRALLTGGWRLLPPPPLWQQSLRSLFARRCVQATLYPARARMCQPFASPDSPERFPRYLLPCSLQHRPQRRFGVLQKLGNIDT